jgi:putative transposase
MEEAIGTSGACAVFGISRATLYRHRSPAPRPEGPRPKPAAHPAELSGAEKDNVIAVLGSPEFADKSPGQVHAILLDLGVYLCSEATMYRLLRERGQAGERRAQATHPAKKKPELMADGPNQVWSWDITKLKGPARGIWFQLYVILDIYSRKVINWEAWPAENGTIAKEFIENAIAANDAIAPHTIHSDRGPSMISSTVAGLHVMLGLDQSFSRPHVSNDNPYSEAHFKTYKYCPAFPGEFGSIREVNEFSRDFFWYYNNEHRHSGIAMHTPASVHDGSWAVIETRRAATLDTAHRAHPERFSRPPQPREMPTAAWINQPLTTTLDTAPAPQNTQTN